MITYIQKDLFTAPVDLIAHGCNCKGGFGSGVAGIIAQKNPEAKNAYLNKYQSDGWRLGEVQIVPVKNSSYKYIANCSTQLNYGGAKPGVVYADYGAIKQVMKELKSLCDENNWTIAIPKIGAGLARGDWKKIESIINEVFKDQEIFVYYL